MQIQESTAVFSFVVLLRPSYRNRPLERNRLSDLLKDLISRFRCPIHVLFQERHNVSSSFFSLISPLIFPVISEPDCNTGFYLMHMSDLIGQGYACVIWDDMNVDTVFDEQLLSWLIERDTVCAAPLMRDVKDSIVPTKTLPDRRVPSDPRVLGLVPEYDGESILYPFDYAGIYDVEKLRALDAFDERMSEGYWQLLDFGYRVWEHGQKNAVCFGLQVRYCDVLPIEDRSEDETSDLFYFKHFLKRKSGARRFARPGEFQSLREDHRKNRIIKGGELFAAMDKD